MKLTPHGGNQALIQSVVEVLNQGESLLGELDNITYTTHVSAAFNATIGGHYRHCLDHFRSLLGAALSGGLNYDYRERGTLIENDLLAALNATREFRSRFHDLSAECLSRELQVTSKTSYSESGSQTAASTVGREIMYAVAHAVHHYALMGIMGGIMGLKMPAGFGVAPSTLKHQRAAEDCEALAER
jgi:uncharacterized damage-inducible protein DinB